ncbi:hypothetical protein CUMW_042560 [Citrus unshiu]|nr:hypothetical protein CUMW_042560 [Citrus unshiu]
MSGSPKHGKLSACSYWRGTAARRLLVTWCDVVLLYQRLPPPTTIVDSSQTHHARETDDDDGRRPLFDWSPVKLRRRYKVPSQRPSTRLVTSRNQPKSTAEKSPLPDAEVAGETFVQLQDQKQSNIPERLKVVCKHLGKSRSASSALVPAAPAGVVTSRRDDSLLQQQDGIQSAILHCKRSFNASRDSESSLLARSVSDPSHQKFDLSRKSSDQGKDGSFEP